VGYTTTTPLEMDIAPAYVTAVSKTVDALAAAGHDVFEVSLSMPDADAFIESFGLIWNTGSAGVPVEDWNRVEPLNRALHEAGKATDSIAYVEAVRRTQLLARPLMAQFVDSFDVLVTPTMATLAPRCGSVWQGADEDPLMALINCFPMGIFTSIFNVTGLPAISLPVHHDDDAGLPACVQITAGAWRDDLALQVATQLETAVPWKDRRPPIS
jgi:amidase